MILFSKPCRLQWSVHAGSVLRIVAITVAWHWAVSARAQEKQLSVDKHAPASDASEWSLFIRPAFDFVPRIARTAFSFAAGAGIEWFDVGLYFGTFTLQDSEQHPQGNVIYQREGMSVGAEIAVLPELNANTSWTVNPGIIVRFARAFTCDQHCDLGWSGFQLDSTLAFMLGPRPSASHLATFRIGAQIGQSSIIINSATSPSGSRADSRHQTALLAGFILQCTYEVPFLTSSRAQAQRNDQWIGTVEPATTTASTQAASPSAPQAAAEPASINTRAASKRAPAEASDADAGPVSTSEAESDL